MWCKICWQNFRHCPSWIFLKFNWLKVSYSWARVSSWNERKNCQIYKAGSKAGRHLFYPKYTYIVITWLAFLSVTFTGKHKSMWIRLVKFGKHEMISLTGSSIFVRSDSIQTVCRFIISFDRFKLFIFIPLLAGAELTLTAVLDR